MLTWTAKPIRDRIRDLNKAISKAQQCEYYQGVDKSVSKIRSVLDTTMVDYMITVGSGPPHFGLVDKMPDVFVLAVDEFDRSSVHNPTYDSITEAKLKILWDRELTGPGWGNGFYIALLKKIL